MPLCWGILSLIFFSTAKIIGAEPEVQADRTAVPVEEQEKPTEILGETRRAVVLSLDNQTATAPDYGIAISGKNGVSKVGTSGIGIALDNGIAGIPIPTPLGFESHRIIAVVGKGTNAFARCGPGGVAISDGDGNAVAAGQAVAYARGYNGKATAEVQGIALTVGGMAEAKCLGVAIARSIMQTNDQTHLPVNWIGTAKAGAGGIAIGYRGSSVSAGVGGLLIIFTTDQPTNPLPKFVVGRIGEGILVAGQFYKLDADDKFVAVK